MPLDDPSKAAEAQIASMKGRISPVPELIARLGEEVAIELAGNTAKFLSGRRDENRDYGRKFGSSA